MAHHHLSLVKTITHSLLLTDTMTKELLIAQLRQGTNGNSILSILDALCSGMDGGESRQDNLPTLDEIQF